MHRTMLKTVGFGFGLLSLIAFVACAEGPKVDGDYSALTQDEQNAEPPPEKSSLPPPSSPAPASTTPKDPPKDSGSSTPPPSSNDAGSSGSSSGTPAAGEDCDMNNPIYIFKLGLASNPPACPCAAGQCCVGGAGCVAK